MKLVAIACARNEADIIEAFVRHTLAYCQQLILMDHGSADATPEILRSLQSEGLNLHVLSDSAVGNFQTAHMNQMLKLAVCEYGADWVVCLDADEFIQGDLVGGLVQAGASSKPVCFKAPLRNYVVHPDDRPDSLNPVERIRYYDLNETHGDSFVTCKVLVPRELAKKETGFLEQGNHRFLSGGFEAPCQMLPGVWYGHFSLRQPCQYAGKLVSKTLQKYRQVAERTHNEDFYEQPYRQLRQSYSTFVTEFPKARLSWTTARGEEKLIADPIEYKGAPLRYTPDALDTDQFIKQILDLTESLARTTPQEPANDADDTATVPAYLSLCAGGGQEGGSIQNQLQTSDAVFVSLAFPLQTLGDCTSLILGVSTEPCILEIDSISLVYENGERYVRTFGSNELKSMLEVQDTGVVIDSAGAIRLLVSHIPVHLKFHGWRKDQETMPVEAAVKLRCVRRPKELVSIILAPNVLGPLQTNLSPEAVQVEFRKVREKLAKKHQEELERLAKRPLKFLLRSWRKKLKNLFFGIR